jgi:YVTN family beta-propeller protein
MTHPHPIQKSVCTLAVAATLAAGAIPAVADGVIYVSNQGSGIAVLDVQKLAPVGQIDLKDSAPRGLAVTPDGKLLLTANLKTSDVAVIDTATLKVVRRIAIGKNPEFLRILPDGSKAFVTYEPSSSGGPPKKDGKEEDDDDKLPGQVAVIDLKKWKVVASIVGAPETEGIEFSPDAKRVAITNEGNDTVTVYALPSNKLVKTVDLHPHGSRPRGIKLAPDGSRYVVTMENSDSLVVLDRDFNFVQSVPTAKGPYGVAFDKSGKNIVVAASRDGLVQVFDGASYAKLADIPVGKRCWHFSYTPDETQLLVACGRSNDVHVIDAASFKVTTTLSGFEQPWGVVAYPKTDGSLDAPAKR